MPPTFEGTDEQSQIKLALFRTWLQMLRGQLQPLVWKEPTSLDAVIHPWSCSACPGGLQFLLVL